MRNENIYPFLYLPPLKYDEVWRKWAKMSKNEGKRCSEPFHSRKLAACYSALASNRTSFYDQVGETVHILCCIKLIYRISKACPQIHMIPCINMAPAY